MCIFIERQQKIKTAKADILCYKVVFKKSEELCSAMIQDYYDYHVNKVDEMPDDAFERKIKEARKNTNAKKLELGYGGFHSFILLEETEEYLSHRIHRLKNLSLAEFIIPKGAKYLTGIMSRLADRKNYFSNKIKFIKYITV